MADDPTVYCIDQVRRFDHDRYLCALFAPAAARARLFALYAFNVEIARVREIVSEPVIGQMRLQWWRDTMAEIAAGKVRSHPVATALARAFAETPVRPELFERLLTGREFDLADAPPASLAALETYADETSATLLRAALDLLDVADPETDAAARHIGLAWGLIGLLRAVPYHAQQRRLYLPEDLLSGAGVAADGLFEGRPSPGLATVVSAIVARADEHLARARAHRRAMRRLARPVLLLATLARRHRARLAQARFDVFSPALRRPTPADIIRLSVAALVGRY